MNLTENLLELQLNETESIILALNGSISIVTITNENWKVFVALIVLSTISLGVAVTIYGLLWEKHNLHGATQFSYLVTFLLYNIVFVPALTPGIADGLEVNPTCFALSVANQYFFISSKLWLLVIGFDILWKIWKFEYIIDSKKHGKTLLLYSIIGWIIPLGMVSCGVMLNLQNREMLQHSEYTDDLWVAVPDFGRRHCRIPNWAVWEIFVFSNCLLHLLIFAVIIFLIMKHRYAVQKTLAERKKNSHESLLILMKLFIVVGLSWSYIALQDLLKAGNINTQQGWGWHLFRVIFFLQGLFISMVYVGNVKTFRQLQDKFPRFKAFVVKFQEKVGCCRHIGSQSGQQLSFSSLTFSIHTSKCLTITEMDNCISKSHNNSSRGSGCVH